MQKCWSEALKQPEIERYSGVRSVDTAAEIMTALADACRPLSLTDLSERCGLAPAKAHRYLVSMVDTGIVKRRSSGLYDLGPVAFRIGLAALARMDTVGHYGDLLPGLADNLGVAALLCVWTSQGPTVTRFERHVHHPVDLFSPGTVLPLLDSATGQAFLNHLPERLTRPVLAMQLGVDEAEAEPATYRGKACSDGMFRVASPGPVRRFCLARAILNKEGEARCVIKLLGPTKESVAEGSEAARMLLNLR